MTTVASGAGAERIAHAFHVARQEGRCALVTYLTAGYPSLGDSPALLAALARGGADVIELGVPFSDPVADGPAIQTASQAALQAGVTPRACLSLVMGARAAGLAAPVLLMGYYNPILAYGLLEYAADCAAAGVDGLIVPDLPPEEAGALRQACAERGLALVYLVAPTTAPQRAAEIAAATQGFLYVVSRLGTTGAALAVDDSLRARLAALRGVAHTPIAVGFGVSEPAQARALADLADGVIVGSAIVQRAPQGGAAVEVLVAGLRAALVRR